MSQPLPSLASSTSPVSVAGELRALAALAFPVVLVQVGLIAMGVVDTMMVGHLGTGPLAEVALGNVVQWGVLVFGQGVLMALDPLVTQAHGAGDRQAVARSFQRGLLLAALLAPLFMLALWRTEPLLLLLRQPAELVPTAAAYARTVAPSVPAFFAFVVVRQTLQGMGIVRPVVVAVIVGNLANVVGNYALVYGHLGAPALGVVGSAWSTTASRYLMTAALAVAALPSLRAVWQRPSRELGSGRALAQMLGLGLPIGLQIGLESWVFVTAALLVGQMGAVAMASHQIAINLASLSFMVPLGIGAAAATRVGNAIGRSDAAGARRSARVALGAGATVMLVSAMLFGLAPRLLARAYTDDAATIEAAALLLPIAALFQIFDGTQAVGCGILRGSGDTRVAAAINVVGYWVLGLPCGMALAFRAGMGTRGLWWGLTLGLMVVAVLLALRVLRRFDGGFGGGFGERQDGGLPSTAKVSV